MLFDLYNLHPSKEVFLAGEKYCIPLSGRGGEGCQNRYLHTILILASQVCFLPVTEMVV